MYKDPLRVVVDDVQNKLDPKSRVNLGKLIPIRHNVRVKSIGVMTPLDLAKLLHYVDSCTQTVGFSLRADEGEDTGKKIERK